MAQISPHQTCKSDVSVSSFRSHRTVVRRALTAVQQGETSRTRRRRARRRGRARMARLTPPKPLTPQMQQEIDTLVFRKSRRSSNTSPVGLLAPAPASARSSRASMSPPPPLMFNISPRSGAPGPAPSSPTKPSSPLKPSSPTKSSARRRSPYMVEALGAEIEYVNKPKAHVHKDMEVRHG